MPNLADQSYEHVAVHELEPHPENPRKGDLAAIGASVDENGFYGAVVAQKSTKRILAGNHRWLAAKEQGLETLPVIWVDVDDQRARRILLADNRTNDLATYDEGALLELLEGLAVSPEELAGSGYDFDALDDMRAKYEGEETLPPGQTDARYAESEEEEAARAATRGVNPSLSAAGLRELILVYNTEDHYRVRELLAAHLDSAHEVFSEATNATVVMAALALTSADDMRAWMAERA